MELSELAPLLAAKIVVDENGCWRWQAAKDPQGYGRVRWKFSAGWRTVFAHRLIYQQTVGDPGSLDLDHLCRVRSCVNPTHLEAVSHAENIRRGNAPNRLREKWASHVECPAGHALTGDNLYVYVTREGWPNKQCRTCRAAKARESRIRRQAMRSA